MRKLFIILFLLISIPCYASPPSRSFTYTTGSVISSSQVTANEDSIFNYLQAGVDAYSDGTIVNADVHSSANIQSDKLNLTAIAQSVANSGSTALNGTTNSIGNGGSDTLTLNVPGGMTLSAATTWTLTGALTFSGTIADLGIVTTADINGGTMDGVQIGGTTATGELIVNDATDDADGLGSQGTSGQFLKSQGTGANPVWSDTAIMIAQSSGTFSAATSISITETISAGSVYKIIFEGIEDSAGTWEPGIRINSDSSGTNYDYSLKRRVWDGTTTGTGGITETNDSHNAKDEIPLVGTGVLLPTDMPFTIELTVTARGGDSQVYFMLDTMLGGVGNIYSSEGVGVYDAGTPTSIQLIRVSGAGTISGRYYVFKLGQS